MREKHFSKSISHRLLGSWLRNIDLRGLRSFVVAAMLGAWPVTAIDESVFTQIIP